MFVLTPRACRRLGALGVLVTLMSSGGCYDVPAPAPRTASSQTTAIGNGEFVADEDLQALLRISLQVAIDLDLPLQVSWNRLIVDEPRASEALGDMAAMTASAVEATRAKGWTSEIGDATAEYTCLEERAPGQSRCRLPVGTMVAYLDRVRVTEENSATVDLGLHGGITETVTFRRSYVIQLEKVRGAWSVVDQRMGEL